MKASTVYLIGLDLGYPSENSHADGIEGAVKINDEKLFATESVNGKTVMTDTHMEYYRKQIETQIREHEDIEFYNLSEEGAKIGGTKRFSEF